jgi:signal transduction histidine kinase
VQCGNIEFSRLADIARRECYNVLRLLRDVSDAGKLFNGNSVKTYKLNLIYLTEKVCEAANILAARRNVRVIFDTDYEELYVEANRDYAERLFHNILSNAIKHSPDGGAVGVNITCGKSSKARISVADEGDGVGEAGMADLFGRYVSGDYGIGNLNMGIGLAIVREIADIFGWNVFFRNRLSGKGAVCVVDIPVLPYDNMSLYEFCEEEKPVFDLTAWL